jgi:hypothetical protein
MFEFFSTIVSGLSRHLTTTCLDYLVFPYLKNNVFKNRPGTIPELMQVITDNCNLIDVPILRRSFENMKHYVWKLFRTFTVVLVRIRLELLLYMIL